MTPIQDLPLPLRLRNALANAGFTSDRDILDFFARNDAESASIPGVGATGYRTLLGWVEAAGAAPTPSARVQPKAAPEQGVEAADATQIAALTRYAPLELAGRWTRNDTLPERIEAGRIQIEAAGGSVEVSTSKDALTLTLEPDLFKRLRDLVPVIAALPHVKELGVVSDVKIVGRMALIRGLDALERAHNGKMGAEKAENAAKTVDSGPEDPVLAPDPDADVLDTPPGWTKCTPNDKIPVPEAVLHDYYSQNGWFRYWGMVDGTPIYFYWCPEKRLQGIEAFPGSDKSGRRVAVQDTPWGPGHVVPVKWANS